MGVGVNAWVWVCESGGVGVGLGLEEVFFQEGTRVAGGLRSGEEGAEPLGGREDHDVVVFDLPGAKVHPSRHGGGVGDVVENVRRPREGVQEAAPLASVVGPSPGL